MKFTTERAVLLKTLSHIQSIVERRNTYPILSNVLVTADETGLSFRATDLDIELIEKVDGEIESPGATTIPAHLCYDIVRKLPDGAQLEFELDGNNAQAVLRAGKSQFKLQTLDKEDFPDLSSGETSHSFELEAKQLRRLIEKTRFAMSTEETRYYLNGIYLHVVDSDKGRMLRAVATDGHRLAQVEIAAGEDINDMPGVIIPRKTVGELYKLIEGNDDTIQIKLSESKIIFLLEHISLTSKLVDGSFPDYARVIPTNNDKHLVVDNDRFSKAVDRVSTVSSDRGRAVKLAVGGERVELSVNNPDSGSALEEIEGDYDGEPIEIGFNAKYLLDIANHLEEETARFSMNDPGSPTLVTDIGDDTTLYVIMPMRV